MGIMSRGSINVITSRVHGISWKWAVANVVNLFEVVSSTAAHNFNFTRIVETRRREFWVAKRTYAHTPGGANPRTKNSDPKLELQTYRRNAALNSTLIHPYSATFFLFALVLPFIYFVPRSRAQSVQRYLLPCWCGYLSMTMTWTALAPARVCDDTFHTFLDPPTPHADGRLGSAGPVARLLCASRLPPPTPRSPFTSTLWRV